MPRAHLPGSRAIAAAALTLLVLATAPATAHDVPTDATLQIMVKPEGSTIRVLVRSPLVSMQEMLFPTSGPGYLDLGAARASGVLADAAHQWVGESMTIFENGVALPRLDLAAVRVSLPSDRSFEAWETALDHVRGEPLPETTQIIWQQAALDMLFESPIGSADSDFSILPRHGRLAMRVTTVLRFLPPGGGVRAYEYHGQPGLVRLDPRWHQAAARFVGSGFLHILDGLDHLLFLACLVIPLRRLRDLVVVASSFTVAHSITLVAAAYGLAPDALWFPSLVETLIALSILTMALENILRRDVSRRWMITFAFGLVHGFGFSFALRENLQFAGSHLLASLLSFNVGVELGQIVVLVLLVPLLDFAFRRLVDERLGVIVLSALIAHTAWHWTVDRSADLARYPLEVPGLGVLPWRVLPWLVPLGAILALALSRIRRGTAPTPPVVPAEPGSTQA